MSKFCGFALKMKKRQPSFLMIVIKEEMKSLHRCLEKELFSICQQLIDRSAKLFGMFLLIIAKSNSLLFSDSSKTQGLNFKQCQQSETAPAVSDSRTALTPLMHQQGDAVKETHENQWTHAKGGADLASR